MIAQNERAGGLANKNDNRAAYKSIVEVGF